MIILIYDHVNEGGSFTFFARVVEFMNSFHADTPRNIKKISAVDCWFTEYKIGKQIYGMIIPIGQKETWIGVLGCVDGEWEDVTKEFKYVAGPFLNFHNMPLRPIHVNSLYSKIAMVFHGGELLEVRKDEIILMKLKERRKAKMESESSAKVKDVEETK
jgi:hypothetical protein